MKRFLLAIVLPAAVSGGIGYLIATRTQLPPGSAAVFGPIVNATLWSVMSYYFPKEPKADN